MTTSSKAQMPLVQKRDRTIGEGRVRDRFQRSPNQKMSRSQRLYPIMAEGNGISSSPPVLRFILSNSIAVHCILRGEYPLNNIPAPHSYKLVYVPGIQSSNMRLCASGNTSQVHFHTLYPQSTKMWGMFGYELPFNVLG